MHSTKSSTKVALATKNPSKLDGVKKAFERIFPDQQFDFISVPVDSGVPDQPQTERETFKGADNRLLEAKKALPNADFYVSIESGLQKFDGKPFLFKWVIIEDPRGKKGIATGPSFPIPPKLHKLLNKGVSLSDAVDEIYGTKYAGQGGGLIGVISKNRLKRADQIEIASATALSQFIL